MKISKLFTTFVLLAGCMTLTTTSQAATLKIGDAAPPLKVAKWVQGDPVESFDSNHVYIVEFWATWCGPCRASIPHLNETWQKYKDKNLIVIGQDCWEQDQSGVPDFIKKMGDKMTYRVALDDKSTETDGAMAANWMKAAGQNGIPTAFIVDRSGKIAWMGHPMSLEESTLDDILANKFDVNAAAKAYEKKQATQEQLQTLTTKLQQAMKDEQWDTADSTLTQIENLLPENARFEVAVTRLQILIVRKDFVSAGKMAGMISDQYPTNAILQNEIAWALATAKGIDKDGLAQAEKIAERANKAAQGKNYGILDTLARTQFVNSQTNEAVATEQKAVDAAPDETKPDLQKILDSYKQGQLPDNSH